MKIRSIASAGLMGETPKGGWSEEIKPSDSVHTLIAVHTEEGELIASFGQDALIRPLRTSDTAIKEQSRL